MLEDRHQEALPRPHHAAALQNMHAFDPTAPTCTNRFSGSTAGSTPPTSSGVMALMPEKTDQDQLLPES